MLEQQKFSALSIFEQSLTATLQADGYGVLMIPVSRNEHGFVKALPSSSDPKVDAYLDLVVGHYGYIAEGTGQNTPYRPAFWVWAKLIRPSDATVLMQDIVVYNFVGKGERLITIAPDPAYAFADIETLMADPPKAIQGIQTAIQQSVKTVGTLLK